jgi:hypothetical protein
MRCRLSLVCVRPIGKYKIGERVTDETEVRALLKERYRYNFALTRSILRESTPAPPRSKFE